MALIKLGIRHFRNLHDLEFEPADGLNIIYGQNASGKSSLLEAIYFLSRAASFRTSRFDRVLERGEEHLIVYATQKTETGQNVSFGLKKGPKMVQIRINEQKITKVSELVKNLPVQVIHPNSHQLMEEGPAFRRSFLDWGVFHVEQKFYPAWHRYQKAIKQRNSILREHQQDISLVTAWDSELVESGLIIDRARKEYVQALQAIVQQYVSPILGDIEVTLKYQPGWQKDLPLAEALSNAIDKDMDRGFTSVGPQRADIQILVDGVLAQDRVSRGQQKILVTCLLLAQAGLFNKKTNRKCLLLIDDVAAELDPENREKLLDLLAGMDLQMFLTSIERETLASAMSRDKNAKMFHVEHGQLTEML